MMSYLSNPSVLELFRTERQRRLRPTPRSGGTTTDMRTGVRVRIGHALIGAGATIAGERVEPARHHHHPQPRAI